LGGAGRNNIRSTSIRTAGASPQGKASTSWQGGGSLAASDSAGQKKIDFRGRGGESSQFHEKGRKKEVILYTDFTKKGKGPKGATPGEVLSGTSHNQPGTWLTGRAQRRLCKTKQK